MDKNSIHFFKELAALLEKYHASFSADCDGDLQFYVEDEYFNDSAYADAESVHDFLAVNQ
jgi:hypothetical protein